MSEISHDPARRCLPLSEWPESDRKAWAEATREGTLLTDAGLATTWRQGTRDRVIQSYGRFLTYLDGQGLLEETSRPQDRVDRDTVVAWVEFLKAQGCASVTVHGYVLNVERALSAMAPDVDWSWLKTLAGRLQARARAVRNKRLKVVPAQELFDLGLRLIESALVSDLLNPKRRAVMVRDGVMIIFLIMRPLRLRSFAGLEIGRHLQRSESGVTLSLGPDDTKNRRPYESELAATLTNLLDSYLRDYRPILLGNHDSNRLWIAWTGDAMTDGSIASRICKITARELGRPINPHLFRDCAATTIAIDDPDHVRIIHALLGHSGMKASERHYNQAKGIEAGRQYQSMIQGLRRNIMKRNAGRR